MEGEERAGRKVFGPSPASRRGGMVRAPSEAGYTRVSDVREPNSPREGSRIVKEHEDEVL